MLKAVLLFCAAIVLGGCSYHAPTLTVHDIRVADRSESGFVLDISIDAENRNEVELPLREVDYTVTLQDGRSFSGVRSPEASLRRLGVQRIRIPASFPITPESPLPSGQVTCKVKGSLGYSSPGEIAQALLDSGVRKPTVSFSGEGTVNFDQSP